MTNAQRQTVRPSFPVALLFMMCLLWPVVGLAQTPEPAPAAASGSAGEAPPPDESRDELKDAAEAELQEEAERAADAEQAKAARAAKKAKQAGVPSEQGDESNGAMAEAGEELAHLDTLGLFQRAGEVERELKALEERLALPDKIDELQKELPKHLRAVEQEAKEAKTEVAQANRWHAISNIRFRFREEEVLLNQYRAPVAEASRRLAVVPRRIEAILREWGHAKEVLDHVGAAEESRARVTNVMRTATVLRFKTRRAETELAHVSDLLDQIQGHIEDVMSATETDAPSILTDYGERSSTPLQLLLTFPELGEVGERLNDTFEQNTRSWKGFARISRVPLFAHLLFTVVLVLLMVRGRRRELHASADGKPKHEVFRHPIAGALLLSSIATIFIYVAVPAIGGLVALSVAVVSASVLLVASAQRGHLVLGVSSVALLAFLVAHVFLVDLPAIEQLVLGSEGLLVALVAWYFRRSTPLDLHGHWVSFASLVAKFWTLASALGLVAWATGFDRLASILIDGTARTMLLAVAFRAAYGVLSSLFEVAVSSRTLSFIRAAQSHGPLIVARVSLLLRYAFLFLWLRGFASSYTLSGHILEAWSETWSKSLAAGSLEFTVGDILTLAFAFVLAVASAKLVRFFLDEDVLSRTNLRYGTRAAISSGVYAVLLGFGVFLALAAGGVKLDKLAILVSALGVGIGFGLQTIVSNFVAGLILIFGRPINVRDVVQVGDLIGRVTKVGFRASTVRTFQGAEVIVPNSAFVADQVINWSLSDENRRIELDVGVAYGTEPDLVLEILLRVAEQNDEVVSQPETEAIFVAFGDSSLNFQLRAWTDNGARWPNIKSDLAIAIDKEFKAAGIEIPFPQRDLHLRSVDSQVGDVLAATGPSES